MKHYWLDPVEFQPRSTCNVAAAIIGGSVIGAGASIYGASKAADAQSEAADKAIANQQQMYGQNKQMLLPYINAGTNMLPSLQGWSDPNNASSPLAQLLKLTTPGADMSATLAQTPGFQFSNTYGQKAVQNSLAARGLGGPGGAMAKGAANYAEGLAGNTWTSVVQQLLNTYQAGGGQMQNVANLGENAGAALAGVGSNTANSISGSLTGAGNAQAAGYNAIGTAAGGVGNSIGTAALLQQLTGGGGGGGGIYGPMNISPGNYGGTGGGLGGLY